MTAKIITFLLIFGINLAIGAVLLFFLMLGLNGFSTHTSNYAFAIFIGGGILVSILTAIGGSFFVKFLTNKEWSQFLAATLSVIGFVALGFVLKAVLLFIAVLAADFARSSK